MTYSATMVASDRIGTASALSSMPKPCAAQKASASHRALSRSRARGAIEPQQRELRHDDGQQQRALGDRQRRLQRHDGRHGEQRGGDDGAPLAEQRPRQPPHRQHGEDAGDQRGQAVGGDVVPRPAAEQLAGAGLQPVDADGAEGEALALVAGIDRSRRAPACRARTARRRSRCGRRAAAGRRPADRRTAPAPAAPRRRGAGARRS